MIKLSGKAAVICSGDSIDSFHLTSAEARMSDEWTALKSRKRLNVGKIRNVS